ncbi:MAG: ABC transporter substrate-binding protein, partial [Candidatus Rokuibacteriota bacterium]
MTDRAKDTIRISRRTVLTGAAAAAGTGLGPRALGGFPAVIAAEPVTMRYLGTAVNQSKDIAQKVKADLGITIEYIPVTTDDVSKRIITQPGSFDVADTEYFSLRKLIPSGNLVGMDAKRIKYADKITPVFTKGEVAGKRIGDQGTAPRKVFYLEGQRSTRFASSPTQWITLIPTTYNADTLGIRPDLIKRPITSWSELLNPEFKGKAS